jgi:acyl-coenzyme A synthetase/AMP-(fatty) acid ligase
MWSAFPGYRAAPPEFNIAREVLDDPIALHGFGNEPAIRYAGGELSFSELRARVDALAIGLQESGVGQGERVLLRGPNSPDWAIAFLALVKLGAIPVLVSILLGPKEIEQVVKTSRIRRAIVDAEAADAMREAWPGSGSGQMVVIGNPGLGELGIEQLMRPGSGPFAPASTSRDAPAFIVYTSGSTGRPKGVVHAHRWLPAVGDMARVRGEAFAPGETAFGIGELCNVGALGHCLLFPLRGGACASLLRGRAALDRILDAIRVFRPTLFFGVASVFRRLIAMRDLDASMLSSIKISVSGGESIGPSLPVEWEKRFGTPLYEHYALSEFQMVLANGPGVAVRPGSTGVAPPGVAVEVLDAALRPAAAGEVGQLAIRGDDPGLFLTYDNQPEVWRRAMRGKWFMTGDLFSRDADGYFWYAGRADDMFKSRGYSIAPIEIENVMQEHPAVAEVAVVGVPDPQISRAIKAAVVLRRGWTCSEGLTSELQDHVRSRLAPYKVPKIVEYRDELPRVGAIGKVNRRALEQDAPAVVKRVH